ISTILWYGYPSLYDRREVSYHRFSDYRNLPVADNSIQQIVPSEHTESFLKERNIRLRNILNNSFENIIKGIPANDKHWCERMTEGKLDLEELKKLKEWKFTANDEIIKNGEIFNQKCNIIKEKFPFIEEPLSVEEREFPLAYGMLFYKSAFQVYMMMSAIYQPQNHYCIMIDQKSSKEFKNSILLLSDCFPNIFVMSSVVPTGWCEFGLARALYNCIKYLTESQHKWEYFQYLSGFDLPLKTNLEMVRIFKQLHGSINMEVSLYQSNRLGKEVQNIKPPLTLWKSSMSSLFPRKATEEMIASNKVNELMNFLQHTVCSDETIWATIAGNPEELKISGGFNASAFFNERTECVKNKKGDMNTIIKEEVKSMGERHPNEEFLPDNYYISRYQVWGDSSLHKCYGKFVSASCVFGINDIPILIKRPELVQHKMYLDYQPAAYFCLWKTIYERSLDWKKQKEFKATAYSELPTVKYLREGKKYFYDDKCLLSLW
ncbi:hypothetical protein Mgra_00009445, partial [Meloidogyne graminicola]